MRRAARTDANQQAIVAALRDIGASVRHTHAVGQDFPDLVVGWRSRTFLAEVKDGNKSPSKQRLTEGQQAFARSWHGDLVLVLTSPDQAISTLLSVTGCK